MTNKELSAAVRAELKSAGIPKSAYSIRVRYCGYSTSIDVTLKDIGINIDRVTKVLLHHKHVDWDERCMEILEGGNTYAHADYDYHVLDAAAENFMDRAKEVMAMDVPLYVGTVIAKRSRNGHDQELIWFKGDNTVVSRKKGGSSAGNRKHYAGDVRSMATALAMFNALGEFPKY